MCQSNSKSVYHTTSMVCYRAYAVDRADKKGIPVSYFNSFPLPKKGVPTEADNAPFHAFLTRGSVRRFFSGGSKSAIYECIMENRLATGHWGSHTGVKTVTGYKLTIVRKVASYTDKRGLYWYKKA